MHTLGGYSPHFTEATTKHIYPAFVPSTEAAKMMTKINNFFPPSTYALMLAEHGAVDDRTWTIYLAHSDAIISVNAQMLALGHISAQTHPLTIFHGYNYEHGCL